MQGEALQAGRDVFRAMAARVFSQETGGREDLVAEEQRDRAKAISYAILYGAGPGKLMQDLGCSIEEARKLIKGWHKAHPGVGEFTEQTLHEARQTGFVETLGRRKRFLPHIKAADRAERARRAAGAGRAPLARC